MYYLFCRVKRTIDNLVCARLYRYIHIKNHNGQTFVDIRVRKVSVSIFNLKWLFIFILITIILIISIFFCRSVVMDYLMSDVPHPSCSLHTMITVLHFQRLLAAFVQTDESTGLDHMLLSFMKRRSIFHVSPLVPTIRNFAARIMSYGSK